MPYRYRDLMWSEMTDRQKTLAGSKSEHKAAKAAYEARQSPPTPTPTPAPSPTPTPTPSPTSDWGDGNTLTGPIGNPETPTAGQPPAANEAKERAQSWADLSRKDKKEQKAAGGTKKSFNRSTGYRAEQINEDRKDNDPMGTKYSEMSNEYKSNTTKKDHKQARKDAGTYTNDRLESYNVDSLDDFDITNTGRGRKTRANRLSVGELNRLNAAGFSKEEIANRAMTGAWADSKKGTKAQALLDSWMSEFIEDTQPGGGGEDTLPGGGEDTLPEDTLPGGGEDTLPGGGEDTLPGGGEDTLPGGGEDTLPGGGGVDTIPGGGSGDDVIDVVGDDNNVIGDDGIINEDLQNTDIEDSFNGGTIGTISPTTTINGNNNYVDNSVDNSNNSRYYGGNNTVWNINNSNESANTGFALGNGNYTGGVTSPLSTLTMLGYGKPDDSPASNAQYVDMYQTLNSDAQRKYADVGSDTANKYIQMAARTNPVNYEGIQKTLSGYYNDQGQFVPGTAQSFFDQALARQVQFMGDYANFNPPNWVNPAPPETIEPDLDELAEDAMNF